MNASGSQPQSCSLEPGGFGFYLESFHRLTFGAGGTRGRDCPGLAAAGSSMEAPPGLGKALRPGTGLAGSAFWGGRGLEKSWGESHKP